jgi:hypothetical protein
MSHPVFLDLFQTSLHPFEAPASTHDTPAIEGGYWVPMAKRVRSLLVSIPIDGDAATELYPNTFSFGVHHERAHEGCERNTKRDQGDNHRRSHDGVFLSVYRRTCADLEFSVTRWF